MSALLIPKLKVGLSGSVQKTISREDTALNYGSGALKTLLATPSLAALMIEAAVKAVDPILPEGFITIGKTLKVTHQEPTYQGMSVTVKADLVEVDENRLVFEITAYDEIGQISKGHHERYIVKQETIIKRAEKRREPLSNKNY
ncbi:MAG: fluoroacetyl-CoA thioesterase [Clostridia bacterium]|nr:fluoroacetyl-CoA thioesterase [Clostridia bacterium]